MKKQTYRIVEGKYNQFLLKRVGDCILIISFFEKEEEQVYEFEYTNMVARDMSFQYHDVKSILNDIDAVINGGGTYKNAQSGKKLI